MGERGRSGSVEGLVALALAIALGSPASVYAQAPPPASPPPPPTSTALPPLPASSQKPATPPAPTTRAAQSAPQPPRAGAQPPPPPPPPYYYPAPPQPPYYPPPPQVVAPPAPTRAEPPMYLPYPDTDAPVPEGYRVDSRPFVGLIGIGIGMLTAGWATSAMAGALAADHANENPTPGGLTADDWTPMYFPVAGPFVTLATIRPGPAEAGMLLCGGIFQTAGLIGILVGSLRRTYRLVRTAESAPAPDGAGALFGSRTPGVALDVTPLVGTGFIGATTRGHF